MSTFEQEVNNAPEEVNAIIFSFDENEELYQECNRINIEVSQYGYEIDWDLSGEITELINNNPL